MEQKTSKYIPGLHLSDHKDLGRTDENAKPSFPLSTEYDFRLACNICYQNCTLKKPTGHDCSENVLIVQHKNSKKLFQIRERINHSIFFGKYKLCQDTQCPRKHNCTFAHNYAELTLWELEKKGKFDIGEFVGRASSKQDKSSRLSLLAFLRQYPGSLMLICRTCFSTFHCLIYRSAVNGSKCGKDLHVWSLSAILAHRHLNGRITLIGQCPLTSDQNVYFGLCYLLQLCNYKWTPGCTLAHSVIEQKFWYTERFLNCTREELVEQVQTFDSFLNTSFFLFFL